MGILLLNCNCIREIVMGRNLGIEYKMRMTQDLKEKIVASAKEHNRSMNADIVARLEQSFIVDKSSEAEVMKTTVEIQQKQINQLHDMVQELMSQIRGSKE